MMRRWAAGVLAIGQMLGAAQDPQVVREQGKPWRVVWADGREAAAFIQRKPVVQLPLALEIAENSCNDRRGITCEYLSTIKMDRLSVRWTKHSDPSKLDKLLRLRKIGDVTEVEAQGDFFISSKTQRERPQAAGKFPAETLSCKDFGWLPGSKDGLPPERIRIVRWEVELMATNPDTRLEENRVTGGGVGIELKRISASSMQVSPARRYTGYPVGLYLGDIISWVVKDDSGELCDISLKPALDELINKINQYREAVKSEDTIYVYGSDEYSQEPPLPLAANFYRFMAKPSDYLAD